jgi:GDP-4-dehydro-6-deoxy-D-mannose reductase
VRAFVTGGHGFVGPWLIQHLEASGDEVVVADTGIDVTVPDAIGGAVADAQPDAIYHLAAQSSVGSSWSDVRQTHAVNTLGTVNVLEAALSCPSPPRVLLVSSAEVYGAVDPEELPVQESAPFRPVTPYAASKAAAELAGLQSWLGRRLEVVRARPFNHTGPGQQPQFVIPALARQVAEAVRWGAPTLQTGNLKAKRDLTDVRDVVRAYRLLIEAGQPGQAYNVCGGRSVAIEDLARRLLELAGVDLPMVVDPARMRPADVPDMRGDPTWLQQATGWQPAIALDQTLADVLTYWMSATPTPNA